VHFRDRVTKDHK